MENREKIVVLLKVMGISPANLGWKYLIESIEMVLDDPKVLDAITKRLYPTIAQKFNSNSSRVERAIRHAVEGAFVNTPVDVMSTIFGNTIRANGKVTNGEFIGTLAELITDEPNNPIWKRSK